MNKEDSFNEWVEEERSKAPPCEACGCLGNKSCGCEPVESENHSGCSLDQCLICPCCAILGKVENMKRWKNIIKFSHDYPKLHGQIGAKLLYVEVRDRKELPDDFIEYDTVYNLDGKTGHYPLPAGKLVILVFLGNHFIPFTTVRPWKPAMNGMKEKGEYYRSKIGELFDIVVEK